MNTETRQYKDVAGNPVTLDWLVRNEPEWAANQIRHRDKLEAEAEHLRGVVQWIANQQNLFFAECSQAEEIVSKCREVLGSTPLNKCPQCGAGLIHANIGDGMVDTYCEECGYPDENRPFDLSSVIDEITDEVLAVVSPEGHDMEERVQVAEAVAKGLLLLPKITTSASSPSVQEGQEGR